MLVYSCLEMTVSSYPKPFNRNSKSGAILKACFKSFNNDKTPTFDQFTAFN